jgi:sugar/nucleoside kinase (ribokinase family)
MLHVIGFGSLNLDEFWVVDRSFLDERGLVPGHEYVRDPEWFSEVYPALERCGVKKGADPGGSAANTVAALNRMGFTTGYFGAVGADDGEVSMRLAELGKPEYLHVHRADLPSGRCISLAAAEDRGKDRALVITPNANDACAEASIDMTYFDMTAWLHLTSFVSPRCLEAQIRVVERLSTQVKVSFDPGVVYCRRPEAIAAILKRTDTLFITDDELRALTGKEHESECLKALEPFDLDTVVVKKGAAGITSYIRGEQYHQDAISQGDVVDTTGAGDVAAAGYLVGQLMSVPPAERLFFAAAAAARSITGYGRMAYPDRNFLFDMVVSAGNRR